MDASVLGQLGMSKTESRVYLALLYLGSGTGSEIAEKANVFRRNAYDALSKLTEKGLVSSVIKDKTYYTVAPPEKLQQILQEKEDSLKKALPELRRLYTNPKIKQKVYLFEGKEGVKNILNEILKEKDWLALGSKGNSKRFFGDWSDYWERKRAMAGTKARVIMNDSPMGRKRGKEIEAAGLAKARLFPRHFSNPASTYVFGKKFAIVLWAGLEPLAIVIDSKEIADAHRKYFNVLWKIAKAY